LRRFGPLIAIVVVVIVVAGVVVATRQRDDSTTATPATTVPASRAGVLSFTDAKAQGIENTINWGDRCDTAIGKLKYPSFFAGDCYAPFSGNNGGATASGVTSDSIKVVMYQAQPSDPVLNYITAAVKVDDTNDQTFQTIRNWTQFYETFYEMYGRKVELIKFTASGTSTDEVSARADATTIAEDIKPFAVWGGPILTTAFEEELAARKVLCIDCGPATSYDQMIKAGPYLWNLGSIAEQIQTHVVEYLSKELKDGNADHAGDPALQSQKRTFGLIYISTSAESERVEGVLEKKLADNGITLAEKVAYKSPVDLQTDAPQLMAKLKAAGVTSVLFSGDPVAPGPLTVAATGQEYFPEWIVTGAPLTDTTAFARTYDQRQWAHAFGVSQLAARVDPQKSGTLFLYRWFFGQDPPAPTGSPTRVIEPALFYAVIQGLGPNLTAQGFQDALFAASPTTRAVTQPSLSYGDKGIWPETDYLGVDDATEVWWNPDATGLDEIQRNGKGMYEYVDGGQRYLPTEWPSRPTTAFNPDGAVTFYPEPPSSEQVPTYPSPAAK
jgi:hypothetical protein